MQDLDAKELVSRHVVTKSIINSVPMSTSVQLVQVPQDSKLSSMAALWSLTDVLIGALFVLLFFNAMLALT